MDIDKVKEDAFGHGFAFGKYTQQCILSDELFDDVDGIT